jgi:soluble lytic murein transglycosylase-like protein
LIDDALHAGRLAAALRVLDDDTLTRRLDSVAYDALRAHIASALFYAGNIHPARMLAVASAARSGQALPDAHWIAGLAAWREGDAEAAGRQFVAMAGNASLSPWTAAAAAYWAARAEDRLGHRVAAEHWLDRAARYDRTFYGLIARRSLGRVAVFQWQVPPLTVRHLRAIADTPPGWRALALLQVGQDDLAEQELRRIHPRDNALLAEALVALADDAGLPALALQVGNAVAAPEGGTFDAALYPLPHWTPAGGFSLDRALLFGIMRQESRFEPRLVSSAGATGIMQLMPETAHDVDRDLSGSDTDYGGPEHRRLYDPSWNLRLGQRYVETLLGSPQIAGNLVYLAAAYNAGPASLIRWRHDMEAIDDPLLFVESVPMRETRDYIHKVLANTWIYQQRLGEPQVTLDALAAGAWPVYDPAIAMATQVATRDDGVRDGN